jgi:flagellar assembly factor FliW
MTPMIDPQPLVTFADGLPGFERCRHFVLIDAPTLTPFQLVQGLDEEAPAFIAIDPRRVADDYEMTLDAADRARLAASPDQPLLWLAVVAAAAEPPTVNLRAPLVINPASMRGIQVIRGDSAFRVDHPLSE